MFTPVVEQANVQNLFNLKQDYQSATNKPLQFNKVAMFLYPSLDIDRSIVVGAVNTQDDVNGEKLYTTHYVGNGGRRTARPPSTPMTTPTRPKAGTPPRGCSGSTARCG